MQALWRDCEGAMPVNGFNFWLKLLTQNSELKVFTQTFRVESLKSFEPKLLSQNFWAKTFEPKRLDESHGLHTSHRTLVNDRLINQAN